MSHDSVAGIARMAREAAYLATDTLAPQETKDGAALTNCLMQCILSLSDAAACPAALDPAERTVAQGYLRYIASLANGLAEHLDGGAE